MATKQKAKAQTKPKANKQPKVEPTNKASNGYNAIELPYPELREEDGRLSYNIGGEDGTFQSLPADVISEWQQTYQEDQPTIHDMVVIDDDQDIVWVGEIDEAPKQPNPDVPAIAPEQIIITPADVELDRKSTLSEQEYAEKGLVPPKPVVKLSKVAAAIRARKGFSVSKGTDAFREEMARRQGKAIRKGSVAQAAEERIRSLNR